jgi:hypothetical protein
LILGQVGTGRHHVAKFRHFAREHQIGAALFGAKIGESL